MGLACSSLGNGDFATCAGGHEHQGREQKRNGQPGGVMTASGLLHQPDLSSKADGEAFRPQPMMHGCFQKGAHKNR
jgi:hypothetical protein